VFSIKKQLGSKLEAFDDEGKGSTNNKGAAVRIRGEGIQGCKRWSLRNRMMIDESTH
jgi:hypothetical protein